MMNSEQAFDALVDGVKSSHRLLDNLGTTIKMRELPSWNERCLRQADLYGTHFINRFWCKWIRPWFDPRRHELMTEAFEIAKLKTQAEMLNAVLEKGNDPTST